MRRAPATAPRATPPSRPASSASASACRHDPRRAGRQQASATRIVFPPIPAHCADAARPCTACSPATTPGCQHTGRGGASIPGPVALALLPCPAAGHLLGPTCSDRGGVRAYHPDLAAPGGAAALAVASRAGPAGGAGHGDGAHGGRGGPPRADRVRPALGQHAARDRDRAAQPARVRLEQGPGPARGGRAQRVPGRRSGSGWTAARARAPGSRPRTTSSPGPSNGRS